MSGGPAIVARGRWARIHRRRACPVRTGARHPCGHGGRPARELDQRLAGRRCGARRELQAEDADRQDRGGRAGRSGSRLPPQLRVAAARVAARRRACVRAPLRAGLHVTTSQYDALLSRREEIMRRSVGIDYDLFRRGRLGWDYEGLMATVGYDMEEAARIQLARGVGATPMREAPNLTALARSVCSERFRRAHLHQGRGRKRLGELQGSPGEPLGLRGARARIQGRDRRDERQLRSSRRVASGSCRPRVHRRPGSPRLARSRPAGDHREGARLRGVRSRGRAVHGGTGALLPLPAAPRRDGVLQRFAVHALQRRGHRDARGGARRRHAPAHRA